MELKTQIEMKRNELLYLAKRNGLSCEKTIKCSKELDQLIIHYQDQCSMKK
ncbi:aspartyl-phosphate phosphatase Spo0E family protein [Evansella halocellulosilytica]|uniref:aspartyl-phosphate phosphatase Spo0E family protein n=1 Tax=Evansella halocellulosilytica TaxID=2011013 RepID=UPI000BB93221|nr:aspartyl-phosphate phosphatase Spo0E family protein [Evansella halocellulosilytica]